MENIITKNFNCKHEIVRGRRRRSDKPKINQGGVVRKGPLIGRGKTPEAPPLWGILSRDWKNRTRYRDEILIGRAQQKRQGFRISRGEKEIKNVGRVSKTSTKSIIQQTAVLAVTHTQRRVFLFSRPSPSLVRRQHMQGIPRTHKGPQFAYTGSLCSIKSPVTPLRHGLANELRRAERG
ncbi:hypothetical protein E2C01_031638 [Portunus trituberculatus]|uniref:Uncharacterized protein n=1 Tax=Portunus trituberculatus TaxID=210409 RepID=A0A5B7F0L5_PORTR|nr:hypothetical protein [Portunus trituberculatus]